VWLIALLDNHTSVSCWPRLSLLRLALNIKLHSFHVRLSVRLSDHYCRWHIWGMIWHVVITGSGKPESTVDRIRITASKAFCNTFIKSSSFFTQWFLLLASVTVAETANWTSADDWTCIEETSTSIISTPWRMCSTRGFQQRIFAA